MSEEPIKTNPPSAEEWKTAVDLLERIVGDRALLAALPEAERVRLVQAAGDVFCPDVGERRRLSKARGRQRKTEKVERDNDTLNETGIRKLRREKAISTPNGYPPLDFTQEEVKDDPDFREVVEPQNCYICKRDSTSRRPCAAACSRRPAF